jgi:stage II sporulation protein AA (anti-sigma F factor antagonist)
MRKEMQVTAERRIAGAVLRLYGELDALACPRVRLAIDAQVAAGVQRLVLDLAHVRFVDSTGLDALFRAARALSKRGGGLALARPSPFCRDVLARVGLDRCIAIVDTDEAALEWLGERARPPAPAAR